MINPDDPTGIEDCWNILLEVASAEDLCVTDEIAAIAQTLGFVLEHARNRGLVENVSTAELDELVDRYKRRGALLQQAIAKHEGRANGN
jgi:hypothetical protein